MKKAIPKPQFFSSPELAALFCCKASNSGWSGHCPCHNDEKPSLSIWQKSDGSTGIKCHAGCDAQAVLATKDLTLRSLYPSSSTNVNDSQQPSRTRDFFKWDKVKHRFVNFYNYRDEHRRTLFRVCRTADKKFFQCRPVGTGLWRWGVDGVSRIPYGLPNLSDSQDVFICEGERDCLTLKKHGITATTNPMGAGKWLSEFNKYFREKDIVILPDNDVAGKNHADKVAQSLSGKAKSIKIVELPNLPPKGDVTDWLEAGNTIEQLENLVEATLLWEPDHGSPISIKLSDVAPEQVSWIWPGWLAAGKLNILDGDPGVSKSTLSVDIAARVSTGKPFPDGSTPERGAVLFVQVEDGLADTLRPRLEAAGANLELVRSFTMTGTDKESRLLSFPEDAGLLKAEILRVNAKLVVIDPLMSFLSLEVNSHSDHEIRRAMAALSVVAQETGAAILLIRHLNKSTVGSAIYRGGGSIGIIASARSAFVLVKEPNRPEGRILASVKCNLAKAPASMRFRVESSGSGIPFVAWEGPCDFSADQLLGVGKKETGQNLEEAKEFLRTELENGPAPVDVLKADAKQAGLSAGTLRRAKKALGVEAKKEGFGRDGKWVWWYPETPQSA